MHLLLGTLQPCGIRTTPGCDLLLKILVRSYITARGAALGMAVPSPDVSVVFSLFRYRLDLLLYSGREARCGLYNGLPNLYKRLTTLSRWLIVPNLDMASIRCRCCPAMWGVEKRPRIKFNVEWYYWYEWIWHISCSESVCGAGRPLRGDAYHHNGPRNCMKCRNGM